VRTSAFALLVFSAGVAHADVYDVTTTADTLDGACDAHCSLREALAAANAHPGLDTIRLRSGIHRLQIPSPPDDSEDGVADEDAGLAGDFDIGDDVVLEGVPGTVIDGGHLHRVFEVLPRVTAAIRGVTIRNGYVHQRGAGLSNAGVLTLERVRIRANEASSGFDLGQGGALFNEGVATVIRCAFVDNVAGGGEASYGEGGAIYNTGELRMRASVFTGNATQDDNDIGGGGAIMNRGGKVILSQAFFKNNSVPVQGHGGAIANRDNGSLLVLNATVSGNHSGEPGSGGGAIANGTAFEPAGTLSMRFVTIADNDGGGLYNTGAASVYNSIVAGNYENSGGTPDYSAGTNCISTRVVTSAGALIGADGVGCGGTPVDNGRVFDDLLTPLSDNGGFGLTHGLQPQSAAIDAAVDAPGGCPAKDMRGLRRPAEISDCDVGAFEQQ
jgi:CSLREA domain-containing protein